MTPERRTRSGEPFWGRRFRNHAALCWAPAKVNLFLEVLGKRSDGYHELETLMLAVDLFDMLEVVRVDDPVIGLSSTEPGLDTGEDNLITRAAVALHARYRPEAGAIIRITKKIPMAAGLGGGSSDAATTILALNDLWGINAPREELAEVAAEVGSDVAFFLAPPAAWCTGRGEVVEPATVGEQLDLVIVKPPFGCSTAEVYSKLNVPKSPVNGDAVRKALRRGNADEIGRAMSNRLQEPATAMRPGIAEILRSLDFEKPAGVQLSGSGSACFALCRDRREAMRVADAVRMAGPAGVTDNDVFVVRSWPTTV